MIEDNSDLTPDEFKMYAKIATIAACVAIVLVGLVVVTLMALIYN